MDQRFNQGQYNQSPYLHVVDDLGSQRGGSHNGGGEGQPQEAAG